MGGSVPSMANDTITFPGCDSPTAPLGVGTWAWGDQQHLGHGRLRRRPHRGRPSPRPGRRRSTPGSPCFDTAEVYGDGESERIIGRLPGRRPGAARAAGDRHEVHAAAVEAGGAPRRCGRRCWRRWTASASSHVDLYQIHGPISLRGHGGAGRGAGRRARRGPGAGGGRLELLGRRRWRSIHAELARAGRAAGVQPDRVLAAAPPPETARPAGRPASSWAWCRWRTRRSGRAG